MASAVKFVIRIIGCAALSFGILVVSVILWRAVTDVKTPSWYMLSVLLGALIFSFRVTRPRETEQSSVPNAFTAFLTMIVIAIALIAAPAAGWYAVFDRPAPLIVQLTPVLILLTLIILPNVLIARQMARGQFGQAAALAKWSARSRFVSIFFQNAMDYNVANALTWNNQSEDALAALKSSKLLQSKGSLASLVAQLYALNLAFLGRDIEHALDTIIPVFPRCADPAAWFTAAYVADLKGDTAMAEKFFASGQNDQRLKKNIWTKGAVFLFTSSNLRDAAYGFLIGHYYLVRGDKKSSMPWLERSAGVPFANCYSDRAKILLEKNSPGFTRV